MPRTRKHPRLNLRFKDHHTLDKYEIAALKQGLSLPTWIKAIMDNEVSNVKASEDIDKIKTESILITRKLMENKASEDEIRKVRSYVKDFIAKIKSYAKR